MIWAGASVVCVIVLTLVTNKIIEMVANRTSPKVIELTACVNGPKFTIFVENKANKTLTGAEIEFTLNGTNSTEYSNIIISTNDYHNGKTFKIEEDGTTPFPLRVSEITLKSNNSIVVNGDANVRNIEINFSAESPELDEQERTNDIVCNENISKYGGKEFYIVFGNI